MDYPRIYALETTNYCNSACPWCPHSKMTREKKYVDVDTVVKVISYMRDIGQEYIALHHMGEPLMHPSIDSIIGLFKIRDIRTELSTNGLLLPKVGKRVLDAGLTRLRIAVDFFYKKEGYIDGIKEFIELADYYATEIHIHTVQGNDLSMFKDYNVVLENKTFDNWAGEVEGESLLDKSNECYFLRDNYVVVTCDGRVIPCCMDYNGDYALGTVDNIAAIQNKPCSLCKGCAKMQFADGGEWLTNEEEKGRELH